MTHRVLRVLRETSPCHKEDNILLPVVRSSWLRSSAVLHPVLYGIFIAAIIIIPLSLFTSIGGSIIDALFGRRR